MMKQNLVFKSISAPFLNSLNLFKNAIFEQLVYLSFVVWQQKSKQMLSFWKNQLPWRVKSITTGCRSFPPS